MATVKKTGNVLLLILMAAMMILAGGCGKDEGDTGAALTAIDFITDFDEAVAAGKDRDQAVLIDFYTDWCGWCKKLDTVTYVDSAVVAMSRNLVFAKIDADADTVHRNEYAVQGFPCVLLINNDGTEIDRIGGYLPPDQFIKTVTDYLNGINTLDFYLAVADTNPNPRTHMAIADKYGDRGLYEKAGEYYRKVIDDDPDNKKGLAAEAMMSLGDSYRYQHQYENAIDQYKQLMKKFKGGKAEADAEIRIAVAYRQMDDTVRAIKAFEDFITHHPSNPDTAYAKRSLDKLKNPPQSEEDN